MSYNTMGNYIDYGSQTLNSLALLPFGQANQVLMMNAADNAVIFGGGTAGPGTVQSITSDGTLTVTGGTGPNTVIIQNLASNNTYTGNNTYNGNSTFGGTATFNGSDTFTQPVNTTKWYDINGRRYAGAGKAQDATSVFIGDQSGGAATGDVLVTGTNNIAIGYQTMIHATTATQNVFIAPGSGFQITSGVFNVGIGVNALQSLTTGNNDVSLGVGAGVNITTGSDNLSIGTNAMNKVTTGSNNVAIGSYAGGTGNHSFCTDIGEAANFYGTGNTNTTIGYQALGQGSTGAINGSSNIVAIGDNTALIGGSALSNSSCLGSQTIIVNSNEVVLGNRLVDTVRSGSTGGFASLGSSTYPYGNVYANALNNGSTLSIPNIASTIATLAGNQVFTGTDDFTNSISVLDTNFIIKNSSDNTKHLDFNVGPNSTNTILQVNCNQSTNQTVNIPNITTTDTFATLGLGEVFTGGCTFSNNLAVTGQLDISNSNYVKNKFVTVSTTTYTVQNADQYIICTNNAGCTITLPNAVNFTGRVINFSISNNTQYASGSAYLNVISASNNVVFFNGTTKNQILYIVDTLVNTCSGAIISNGANWQII